MTKINEVYKCNVCGNIVEMVHEGAGQLVCCGQPMQLMKENTTDAAKEKHVPVIGKNGNEIKVKVGSVEHPMLTEHYIEWIELLVNNKSCKKFLKPGEIPEAVFRPNLISSDKIIARAYCNLHGLWKSS